MKTTNKFETVEIFSGTVYQAEMIKNLLENEGIYAYIKDEIIGTIAPWHLNPGPGAVAVVVSSLDFDRAKLLVEEYEKSNQQD